MIQHRFRTTALVGEWRPTRKEACQDALKTGLMRPDDDEPDGMRWAVPGVIEITDRPPCFPDGPALIILQTVPDRAGRRLKIAHSPAHISCRSPR